MTQATRIIDEMERSAPAVQAQLQAAHSTDAVFRSVLTLAYDPFEQHDTPPRDREPDLLGQELATQIDAYLDSMWVYFDADVRSGRGYEELRATWHETVAWPLFDRVLHKGFVGVAAETINEVWGPVALFNAGDVGDGPPLFPCVAVPWGRTRRLLICRPRNGRARLDLFTTDGRCETGTRGVLISLLREERDWAQALVGDLAEGFVLDGFVHRYGLSYMPFDIVPLPKFREQALTLPYVLRGADLDAVFRLGDDYVLKRVRIEHLETANALVTATPLAAYSDSGCVVGIDPQSHYPYNPSHAWRWLFRDGEPVQ